MKYFTYGSNMDLEDLQQWCGKKGYSFPDLKTIGTGFIENFELAFNYYSRGRSGGAANIINKENNQVYGLLFEIDDYGLEILRKKEGYPNYYGEITVNVTQGESIFEDVLTYKVVTEKEFTEHQKPTQYYMDVIMHKAIENNFPDDYIAFLKQFETQGIE